MMETEISETILMQVTGVSSHLFKTSGRTESVEGMLIYLKELKKWNMDFKKIFLIITNVQVFVSLK